MFDKHDRRSFLKTSGIGAAALGSPSLLQADSKTQKKPNILWLVSEDNSPWLGCYGDDYADTPSLDKLAKEGIVFTNAFANAPVCAAARSTIHTGMYASSLGTQHMRSANPMPGYVRFFTEYLRQAGYFCTNCFKTDYNTTGTPKQAWDENGFSASWKHAKGKPFFSFVNYMVSHESSMHKKSKLSHDPTDAALAPYHPDTPEIKHDYAQYYDMITKMDEQAGKEIEKVKKAGLWDDTIVFYFSDHGGVMPRSKRFVYDSGMKVPMIVRFPEKYQHLAPYKPGEETDRIVSFVDLAPTILSIAGIPSPDYMQG